MAIKLSTLITIALQPYLSAIVVSLTISMREET